MKKQIISAATLSGYAVRGRDNEDLGCIEELMVLPGTGQITYAVLSISGFPGVGGKLLVVPWSALALDLEQRVFILEADRALLSSAPSFQEEHWPDFGDHNFAQEVHRFYGLRPCWEAA